jgi:hypothetical protein
MSKHNLPVERVAALRSIKVGYVVRFADRRPAFPVFLLGAVTSIGIDEWELPNFTVTYYACGDPVPRHAEVHCTEVTHVLIPIP